MKTSSSFFKKAFSSPFCKPVFALFTLILFSFAILTPFSLAYGEAPSVSPQGAMQAGDISKVFSNRKTIGGSFAVGYKGSIIYEQYYGYAHKADQTPVTQDTHIRVSSVTKMVTAIGAMQLVEQGLIDLDEDISTYLGFKVYNPYYPDIPITVRQIMTHTSTLNGPVGGSGERSLEEVIGNGKVKNNFLKQRPGAGYKYSNFGYGVLGSIMEAVSGENINHYMKNHVFAPLGIDAAYHPTFLTDQNHLATTYEKGKVFKTGKAYLNGYSLFDGDVSPNHHYLITFGNLWIKVTDLTKLLICLCGNGSYNGVSILAEDTVLAMREDQQGKGSVTGNSIYALGIERVTSLLPNRLAYGHQGMSRGMMANAYFDPQTSLCFVVITNGCNQARENTISLLARNLAPLAYDIAGVAME